MSRTLVHMISIRDFAPGDEQAFFQLNEEWITRYFVIEEKDLESLRHPRETILDPGGRIFLACNAAGAAVGCCALKVMTPGEFEVVKMGVTEASRGSGIGRRLLVHTLEQADAMAATRLYLETNRILAPAIKLYESLGFTHLPPERIIRSPYARANVYMERIGRVGH